MPSPIERRAFPRYRSSKRGVIFYEGGTAECMAVDSSDGGAKLLLRAGEEVPDLFELQFGSGLRRQAQVVWRGYPHCGVAYRDQK